MKSKKIQILLSFFIINIALLKGYSQGGSTEYSIALESNISTNSTLPFWMRVNKFGTVPNSDNVILNTSIFSDFKTSDKDFNISYKASFSTFKASTNDIIIDELYVSLRHLKWQLDLGSKHSEILWEGLSSSNGNIVMSNNARSFPGYNFTLIDYVKLPFAKNWLSVKGNYGDYLLNDTRFVENTRLHAKSIFFKSKLNSKVELITGINHYVQWGGTSSTRGKQPSGFKDYLKIVTGSSGGENAHIGDQINTLGNHLASYLLQLNYKGEKTNWNLYMSHLYEDRSGREFLNFPDGLYGFFIDFKNKKDLVTQLLFELTYTKNASGTDGQFRDDNGVFHARSGRDDYFNSFIYESGWTFFGNTIGSPYFTTVPVDENGITKGIVRGDNRFMAFNIGFKGNLLKTEYKAMFSHITYFGWFDEEYVKKPQQFSGIIELKIPKLKAFPVEISLGTAFDLGTYRPNNIGGFLKLTKRGYF